MAKQQTFELMHPQHHRPSVAVQTAVLQDFETMEQIGRQIEFVDGYRCVISDEEIRQLALEALDYRLAHA